MRYQKPFRGNEINNSNRLMSVWGVRDVTTDQWYRKWIHSIDSQVRHFLYPLRTPRPLEGRCERTAVEVKGVGRWEKLVLGKEVGRSKESLTNIFDHCWGDIPQHHQSFQHIPGADPRVMISEVYRLILSVSFRWFQRLQLRVTKDVVKHVWTRPRQDAGRW